MKRLLLRFEAWLRVKFGNKKPNIIPVVEETPKLAPEMAPTAKNISSIPSYSGNYGYLSGYHITTGIYNDTDHTERLAQERREKIERLKKYSLTSHKNDSNL